MSIENEDRLITLIIDAKRTDPETGSFTEYLASHLNANDVIPVVRCKDCRWWKTSSCFFHQPGRCVEPEPGDYCSYADHIDSPVVQYGNMQADS